MRDFWADPDFSVLGAVDSETDDLPVGQLCGIGQHATWLTFSRAIETASGEAEVVLGPQGGFRKARADLVLGNGSAARLELYEGHGRIGDYIKPLLVKSTVAITETRLTAKRPARRAADAG